VAHDPWSLPASIPATGLRGGAAQADSREPFAALDAGPAPGALTWTHAGPRQAEAGFEDPALGWVGVRAQVSGGAVHAAVVPGSDGAALELGRHMESLGSYLAEQHTPLGSLALASPGARDGDSPSGADFQQQMGQDPGRSPDQERGGGEQTHPGAPPETGPASGGARVEPSTAVESVVPAVGLERTLENRSGTHISVMA
jgi:hypothetical protein